MIKPELTCGDAVEIPKEYGGPIEARVTDVIEGRFGVLYELKEARSDRVFYLSEHDACVWKAKVVS